MRRHFTRYELFGLYQYDFDENFDVHDRRDFDRIEDTVLRRLIDEHRQLVVAYCEHDSFLKHQFHEQLTDEEKRQAQIEGNESPKIQLSSSRFAVLFRSLSIPKKIL